MTRRDSASQVAVITLATLTSFLILALVTFYACQPAGAVTRPDYAGLGQCAPDVTHVELHPDGTALVAFTIPDRCAPQSWHAATFHVPNRDNWHTGQTPIHGGPLGPLGPGPYEFHLTTSPGDCQVDLWLDGQVEPYASDTSLTRGWDTCAPHTDESVSPSAPHASGDVPLSPAVDVADATSGGRAQSDTTPPVSSGPAAAPHPNPDVETEVAGVTATRQLADTGATHGLLIAGGAALILAGTGCLGYSRQATRGRRP